MCIEKHSHRGIIVFDSNKKTVQLLKNNEFLTKFTICFLQKGNTALHIASLAGQEEIVKILVQNGAKVNVQSQVSTHSGWTIRCRKEMYRFVDSKGTKGQSHCDQVGREGDWEKADYLIFSLGEAKVPIAQGAKDNGNLQLQ